MPSGEFCEWGPRRIDELNTRLTEAEHQVRHLDYRMVQAEKNHQETMKTINEFVGESRSSFGSVHETINDKLSGIHDKINGIASAQSEHKGAAKVLAVVAPILYSLLGAIVALFAAAKVVA